VRGLQVSSGLVREQVNQWIRTQNLSDGVIDFDAAVRDPNDPSDHRRIPLKITH
jgi:hypothetical protein